MAEDITTGPDDPMKHQFSGAELANNSGNELEDDEESEGWHDKTVEIEINTDKRVEVKYREKYVKYPVKDQLETGVEGYFRRLVDWQTVSDAIDEITGSRSQENTDPPEDDASRSVPDLKKNVLDRIYSLNRADVNRFIRGLFKQLGGEDFLEKTHNHMIINNNDFRRAEYVYGGGKTTFNFNATLDRMFDPGTEIIINRNPKSAYSRETFEFDHRKHMMIMDATNLAPQPIYEGGYRAKQGGLLDCIAKVMNCTPEELLENNNYEGLTTEDIEHKCNENNLFFCTEEYGFSATNGMLWSPVSRGSEENIIWGFGDRQNGGHPQNYAWERYLKEYGVIKYLCPTGEVKGSDGSEGFHRDTDGDLGDHDYIPIMMFNPAVGSLRWCLADYAYGPTQKGINFLEFVSPRPDDEQVFIDDIAALTHYCGTEISRDWVIKTIQSFVDQPELVEAVDLKTPDFSRKLIEAFGRRLLQGNGSLEMQYKVGFELCKRMKEKLGIEEQEFRKAA